jgi:hypothetical protein
LLGLQLLGLVSQPGHPLFSWRHRCAEEKTSLLIAKSRTSGSFSQSLARQEHSANDHEEEEEEAKLNDLVGEAISQGLSHFGGKNVVESLIYILELEHSVNLRNVANELDALRRGFESMFGNAAYVVEEKVRNNLAKNLGLDPGGRTLEELIEAAKKSLGPNSKEETMQV